MKLGVLVILLALSLCTSWERAKAASLTSSESRQERRLSLSRYVRQIGEAAEALARAPVEAADRVKEESPLTRASAVAQSTWHSLADLLSALMGEEAAELGVAAHANGEGGVGSAAAQLGATRPSAEAPSNATHRQALKLEDETDEVEEEEEMAEEDDEEDPYTHFLFGNAEVYTDVVCNAPSVYTIPRNATLLCFVGSFYYFLPAAFVCGLQASGASFSCYFTAEYGVGCACPSDQFALYSSEMSSDNVFCYPRLIDVQVQLTGAPLCHFASNAALGLPATQVGEYCIRTQRNSTITVQVSLQYGFALTAELRDFIDSTFHMKEYNSSGASQEYYTLNMSSASGTADGDMCTAAATLPSIQQSLFSYHPMGGSSGDFAISASYDMDGEIKLFASVIQFTHPEEMRAYRQTFSAATYMLSANGSATYTVQYDLSAVPDTFIEGGRMYIEIGASGDRLLDQVRVARLHIDFEDWVPPVAHFSYKKDRSMFYFCAMIVTLVVVVGFAFAVFWLCFKADDEGDEDTFIEKVDRQKEKKPK